MIKKSKKDGAKMVFLPEAFDYLGRNMNETHDLAETLDGTLIQKYRELAIQENIWISLGGAHIKMPAPDTRVSNCHVVINDQGVIAGTYDKTHLFDVSIPGKVELTESRYVRPGDNLSVVVPTPLGPLGLGICYDVRFPELSMALRESGARFLTFPSAFSVPTGSAGHWEILLRSRAIETQCYVIAAAQVGRHNERRESYGHALVVDPWGEILCDLEDREDVAIVDIDTEKIEKIRRNMPLENQRRYDLYPSISLAPHRPSLDDNFKFGDHAISGHHVFLQTAHSFAFVNLSPVVEGHVLVSPIRKSPHLRDLTEAEISDLYRCARRVADKLQDHYKTSSMTVTCQDGPLAGQTVQHVHVHILPRRENDFAENDKIYEELEERQSGTRKKRTFDEMQTEAETFKQLFFND